MLNKRPKRPYVSKKVPFVCKMCGKKGGLRKSNARFCKECYRKRCLEYFKIHNGKNRKPEYAKKYNITIKEYNDKTKHCCICGFSLTVDLHHKDGNKKNNSLNNLVGLCPNHHQLTHRRNISFEDLRTKKYPYGLKTELEKEEM